MPAAKQRIRRRRACSSAHWPVGVELRAALEGVPLNCRRGPQRYRQFLADELPGSDRSMQRLSRLPTCTLYASIIRVTKALRHAAPTQSVDPTEARRAGPGDPRPSGLTAYWSSSSTGALAALLLVVVTTSVIAV